MSTLRWFLFRAWLLPLAALAGCSYSPGHGTPLSGTPPPREGQGKREILAGFSVLLDDPGRPAPARVIADVGAFAQQRGFVRQSAATATERYVLGNIVLDVGYQAADVRVVASLHSPSSQLSRKFADRFFQDFDREYGGRYGEGDPIFENDYLDDSALFYRRGNGGARGGGGGH